MSLKPRPVLLLSDFTIDNLAALLESDAAQPALACRVAPFGQAAQALADEKAECWRGEPSYALVWTRPEAVSPAFAALLRGEKAPLPRILREVDEFCALLLSASKRTKALLVPTWVVPPAAAGGLGDLSPKGGISHALLRMNLRLCEKLAAGGSVFPLNAQRWVEAAGPSAFSEKLWYLGKVPYSKEVFAQALLDLKAAVRALEGGSRKLVLLDLDDTLWGGIVGDAGLQGLRLGGHDPLGEAYADFQRALKALSRRGILLGIVSKNEERAAFEAIDGHPEMVLRRKDFAGWRIDWKDKALHVAELAAELNLGLQSVVFIDDSPAERERVREAYPEVLVPDWPQDPMRFCSALAALRCFDAPALSREDRLRAASYAGERERSALKARAGSAEDWLKKLKVLVRVEPLAAADLPRAAQLLNKTNQMNLSTRRLTEAELKRWAEGEGRRVWTFRVSDRFGDSGLVGLLSVEHEGGSLRLVDFILSCRVFGRRVEDAMLKTAADFARAQGAAQVAAEYLPTPKNAPCLGFLESSGLAKKGRLFSWPASKAYPAPKHIEVRHGR